MVAKLGELVMTIDRPGGDLALRIASGNQTQPAARQRKRNDFELMDGMKRTSGQRMLFDIQFGTTSASAVLVNELGRSILEEMDGSPAARSLLQERLGEVSKILQGLIKDGYVEIERREGGQALLKITESGLKYITSGMTSEHEAVVVSGVHR
ncbi:Uncharacterised protein [Candidatus Burarchaeum australiense]|nr:Uncharacterised protein [Candidatus Burarchaeum australiense]